MILYDGLLFTGKPDLSTWLSPRLKITNAPEFYAPGNHVPAMMPSRDLLNARAQAVSPSDYDYAILDFESWNPPKAGVWNYHATALWYREDLHINIKTGLYGLPPIRDYWRAIKHPNHGGQAGFEAWQSENDQLVRLADVVDAFFPSLYTFYPDRDGWKAYATANVEEARRLANGRPVVPYIWPYYHQSNATLGGTPLSGSYWREQLLHLESIGVEAAVVWGGWQLPWNPAACWWLETQDFVEAQ